MQCPLLQTIQRQQPTPVGVLSPLQSQQGSKYSIPWRLSIAHATKKRGDAYLFPLRPGSGGGTSGLPYASVFSAARQSGQYHLARREGISPSVMLIQGR